MGGRHEMPDGEGGPSGSVGNFHRFDVIGLFSPVGQAMSWSHLAYLTLSAAAVAAVGYLAWYGLRKILKW